ncbi:MAG TPA: LemA family protein [Methylomirabilota bacterium]|jgi:LemA protein|nr:LemA family protein [Methylomirabilota bacterium]
MGIGMGGWIFLAVVVVLVIWVIGMYNGLVTLRNRFRNAFSQIDVQLKRRYDLIPNLVETAKAYMAHERQTLDAVISARAGAVQAAQRAAGAPGGAEAMRGLAQAEAGLAGALGRLFVVVEAYPQLKANENMLAIQEELSSTENRIAFARQGYNDSVMEYNIGREKFPSSIIAGMFGFTPAEQLASTDAPEERKAPRVSFS